MIAEQELSLLKPSAFVVNTARGAVIKKTAILDALRSGRLAGAGLDVVEDEPLKTAEEAATPNLIVTCHAAFSSLESKVEMRRTAAGIARAAVLGEPLETLFTVAKEIGFDGIEYCMGRDYGTSVLWQADGPEKLKTLADKDGMEVSSLSPGVFASLHPALPDTEKRAEGRQILLHLIEVCPRLDTHDILVPMFPQDVEKWSEETT